MPVDKAGRGGKPLCKRSLRLFFGTWAVSNLMAVNNLWTLGGAITAR